jgi:hypothetical protein
MEKIGGANIAPALTADYATAKERAASGTYANVEQTADTAGLANTLIRNFNAGALTDAASLSSLVIMLSPGMKPGEAPADIVVAPAVERLKAVFSAG